MTSSPKFALVPSDANLTSERILANTTSLKRKRPGTLDCAAVPYNLDRRKSEEPQSLNGTSKLDADRPLSAPSYSIIPSPHIQKSEKPENPQEAGTSMFDPIEIDSSDDEVFVEFDPFYDTLSSPASKAKRSVERVPLKPTSTIPVLQTGLSLNRLNDYYHAYEITTNKVSRKPYLSKGARAFLHHLGDWSALSAYDNEILHVDFSLEEVELIKKEIHVPGRTRDECIQFAEDYPDFCLDYNQPQIIKIDTARRTSRSVMDYITAAPSFLRQRYRGELGVPRRQSDRSLSMLRNLKPCSTFNHSSGDVIDFAFSPINNTFAVCCNTLTNDYNRPGNLLIGDATQECVSSLNGHADRTVGAEKYYTVSDIRFSNDGEYLYSGSYDNTVKIWNMKGEMVGCLTGHGRITALSTTLCSDRVLAVAADDGNVYLYDVRNPGKSRRVVIKAQNDRLCGAFLVPGHGHFSHWMLAGYEAKDASSIGALYAYDVLRGTTIQRITPSSNCQSAACFHPSANYFIVGAIGPFNGAGPTARSVVRIFDPRMERVSMEIAIDCTQKDINKVTISPCAFRVTSSGTDGRTFVWDLRTIRQMEEPEPLHVLAHGPTKMVSPVDGQLEDWDTGVAVAEWLPQSDYLMTGGSDGFLKLWDVRLGTPFLWNIAEFDSAVSTADFNCDRDLLGVGESSGRVTFLDWHGPAVGEELRKFQLNQGRVEQAGNEGIQAARELIDSGRVVIHENGGARSVVGV